jgi:K+-transporting ATPase ATPase F chain
LTHIKVAHVDDRSTRLAAGQERFAEDPMIIDYSLAGLVTAGLLIYLAYVLLRPERF